MAVFWVVSLRSLVEAYRRFESALLPPSTTHRPDNLHGVITQNSNDSFSYKHWQYNGHSHPVRLLKFFNHIHLLS
jgi:hypothetical protein